jgi:hypothetical protein
MQRRNSQAFSLIRHRKTMSNNTHVLRWTLELPASRKTERRAFGKCLLPFSSFIRGEAHGIQIDRFPGGGYFTNAGELRMVRPPTLSAKTAALTPGASCGLKLSISSP